MSWENDYVLDLTPEEEIRLTERQRRHRLEELGIPRKYWNSNITGLKSIIESSKEGTVRNAFPENMESEVLTSMGFKGKSFKNAWKKLGNNVAAHREVLRLQQEEQNLRRNEEIALIEANLAEERAELAREQANRNARQAILNRELAMRDELKRIHRELQPGYIKASKNINREQQRKQSRKARGKNYNRYVFTQNKKKKNVNNSATKVNKRHKTRARNTQRHSRH